MEIYRNTFISNINSGIVPFPEELNTNTVGYPSDELIDNLVPIVINFLNTFFRNSYRNNIITSKIGEFVFEDNSWDFMR